MLNEAFKNEILSPRALAYRRNVLALATVVFALYWYPSLNYSDLSFLGVQHDDPTIDGRWFVTKWLMFFLVYNFVSFAYFAWRDERDWWREASLKLVNIQDANYLPERKMYFGAWPTMDSSNIFSTDNHIVSWEVGPSDNDKYLVWTGTAQRTREKSERFKIEPATYKAFKEKYSCFFLLDVGLPVAAFIIALSCFICALF